jgi:prepilin-type N-terminal cleavage/methylation domain-containing protein
MFTGHSIRTKAFTLVEIMIVVAIIALLAAIAVPGFLRARKRSQASRILNDLRLIDSAGDQYAIETNRSTGSAVNVSDWTNYLKKGSQLYNTGADLFGNPTAHRSLTACRVFPRIPRPPSRTWRMRISGRPISDSGCAFKPILGTFQR